jgi:hypothetical protein
MITPFAARYFPRTLDDTAEELPDVHAPMAVLTSSTTNAMGTMIFFLLLWNPLYCPTVKSWRIGFEFSNQNFGKPPADPH